MKESLKKTTRYIIAFLAGWQIGDIFIFLFFPK